MTRTRLQLDGFGAVDGELMVDLGLLAADLVLWNNKMLLMVNSRFVCVFFFY